MSSTGINTDNTGRGISSTTINMNKLDNATSDDDEPLAFTNTQDSRQRPKYKSENNSIWQRYTRVNGPSTDFTGDSATALHEDNFTASDDTLSTTNFASVSDDPMTWSVLLATMVALPKPLS